MQAQDTPTRDRASEALAEIVAMFESGQLPAAIAQTRIARERHDRPMCEWSLGNQLLAFWHGTDDARGFKQWKAAGRSVRKGARAFSILAPCTVKRAEVDESGAELERVVVTGFRGVPVFRLEDTDGADVEYPDYSPAELPPLLEVAERLGVPVRYLPNGGGARGAYNTVRGDITLATHDVDTFFHELAHAAHATVEALQGGQNPRQEIVAETVAATLCRLYGYDGYIAEARDYVGFYAGHDQPGKAVVKLVATVAKVLDVILGEGASMPSSGPRSDMEPAQPAPPPMPARRVDWGRDALAALKGTRPYGMSFAYKVNSYGFSVSQDERIRRAYIDAVGHEPPDPYSVPGRFQQFAYSRRAKDAGTILSMAKVA